MKNAAFEREEQCLDGTTSGSARGVRPRQGKGREPDANRGPCALVCRESAMLGIDMATGDVDREVS